MTEGTKTTVTSNEQLRVQFETWGKQQHLNVERRDLYGNGPEYVSPAMELAWAAICALRPTHETLSDEPRTLQTERDVYCLVLGTLVRKLDAIHEDPRYKAVWESFMLHGGRYTEPTYTEELERARAVLNHYDEVNTKKAKLGDSFPEDGQ